MKKKSTSTSYAVSLIALCTVFSLSVLFLFLSRTPAPTPTEEDEDPPVYIYVTEKAPSLPTEGSAPLGWTLRDYEGRIGVFDGGGRLCYLSEIYVKTLPKADRILLREGITVTSKQALDALIEDYSS